MNNLSLKSDSEDVEGSCSETEGCQRLWGKRIDATIIMRKY